MFKIATVLAVLSGIAVTAAGIAGASPDVTNPWFTRLLQAGLVLAVGAVGFFVLSEQRR